MKTCKDCHLEKALSDFYTYKTRQGGREHFKHCKECQKKRSVSWQAKNPDNVKRHTAKKNRKIYSNSRQELSEILSSLTIRYGNRSRNDLAIAYECERSTWDEIFKARTSPQGECLMWTLSKRNNGYGQYAVAMGDIQISSVMPHRLSYALAYGFDALPVGMTGPKAHTLVIDHICNNRLCVNPDHLQVVTQKRNMELRRERAA